MAQFWVPWNRDWFESKMKRSPEREHWWDIVDRVAEQVADLISLWKWMNIPWFWEVVVYTTDIWQLWVGSISDVHGSKRNFNEGREYKWTNIHSYLLRVKAPRSIDELRNETGEMAAVDVKKTKTHTQDISLQDLEQVISLVWESEFISKLWLREWDVLIWEGNPNDRWLCLVIRVEDWKIKYWEELRPDTVGVIL